MATAIERTNIIKLVTAMFNAAPGATYLSELTNFFDASGGTSLQKLSALATALSNTTAYRSLNPGFQVASEFASVFLTPFGLQANQESIDFITARFNAGMSKGQIAFEATLAINNSTAPVFASARAILDNKTNVAEYFSVTKMVAQTSISQLTSVLANVTSDPATVTSQRTAVDNGLGTTGNVFTLTTGVDSLSGTTTNDSFSGVLSGTTTLGASDTINGGDGTDTLTLTAASGATTITSTQLTAVETLTLTASADATLTVTGVTGLTTINNTGSAGFALAVTGVAAVGTVGVTTSSAGILTTVTYTEAAVAGLTDTVTLNLNAASGTVNLNSVAGDAVGVEIVNVVTAGTAAISTTIASNDTSVVTVNVAGATAATIILGTSLSTTVKTVNASTMTGALTITGTGTSTISITGGTGADQLTGSDGIDTIIGGAGNDTITGRIGNDILTGGTGVDAFVFGATLAANGLDSITDFTVGLGGDILDVKAFLNATFDAAGGTGGGTSLGVTVASTLNFGTNVVNVIQLTDTQILTAATFGSTASTTVIQTVSGSKYLVIADVALDVDAIQNVYFVTTSSGNVATVELVGTMNEGALVANNFITI